MWLIINNLIWRQQSSNSHPFWSELVLRRLLISVWRYLQNKKQGWCLLINVSKFSPWSLPLNIIVSHDNVSCLLTIVHEILIASTQFLVVLVTRKVQFWTLWTGVDDVRTQKIEYIWEQGGTWICWEEGGTWIWGRRGDWINRWPLQIPTLQRQASHIECTRMVIVAVTII